MIDLRIESRFKNAPLYSAMIAYCLPEAIKRQVRHYEPPLIAVFAELTGAGESMIRGYLNLKMNPRGKNGDLAAPARQICTALNEDPEDLFPRHIYELSLPPVAVIEVDSVRMVSLSEVKNKMIDGVSVQQESIEQQELLRDIEKAVEKLKPQRRKVLQHRFGLHGVDPKTLDQTAECMGVGRGRVRQIEASALKDLRSPELARALAAHL